MRRLQLALREKERDLERLRCILSNNEETITVCSIRSTNTPGLHVYVRPKHFSIFYLCLCASESGCLGARKRAGAGTGSRGLQEPPVAEAAE